MNKMGRPSVEDPKNKRVSMRVTEGEYLKIIEYAQLKRMTVAELLKIAIGLYIKNNP